MFQLFISSPPSRRVGGLPAELDHLEVAGVKLAEGRDEEVHVPARVAGAGDIHVRAVVGQDQAVGFEGLIYFAHGRDCAIMRFRCFPEKRWGWGMGRGGGGR